MRVMETIPDATATSDLPTFPGSSADVDIVTRTINAFMPWLLIVTGSICNVLIILGMRSKSFWSLSASVYMTVGAVNDLTSLNICLIAHWLHLNFPETITRGRGSDGLCRFFNFYGWGQADFGIMLTSAMTADRAYAILRPMTKVNLVKRGKKVIVICVIITASKEFHFLFTSVIVDISRIDRLCDVNYNISSNHHFYTNFWPWIDTVFVTFCFIVMVISNTILIGHVRRNRKGRQLRTREDIPGSSGRSLTRSDSIMSVHSMNYESVATQVTRMLLAESIAFILLSYPFSVHLIVTSSETTTPNALAFTIVFYLLYASKCVNFIVYSIAGRRFRKVIRSEVLIRVKCLKLGFWREKISSESGGNRQTQTGRTEKGEDRDIAMRVSIRGKQ